PDADAGRRRSDGPQLTAQELRSGWNREQCRGLFLDYTRVAVVVEERVQTAVVSAHHKARSGGRDGDHDVACRVEAIILELNCSIARDRVRTGNVCTVVVHRELLCRDDSIADV